MPEPYGARLHINHGRFADPSYVTLTIDRGLKSGKLDEIPMTEAQLLALIEDAAKFLNVLREQRTARPARQE